MRKHDFERELQSNFKEQQLQCPAIAAAKLSATIASFFTQKRNQASNLQWAEQNDHLGTLLGIGGLLSMKLTIESGSSNIAIKS